MRSRRGIEVETDITEQIMNARRLGHAIWDRPDAGPLIAAITKLAAKLHPVTAETLRACREDSPGAIRSYKRIVYCLAGFVTPLSMISFIYTAISNSISTDLKTANDLAVTLHMQLDTSPAAHNNQPVPPGSLSALQQFVATMRAIHSRTRQLNWFVPYVSSELSQNENMQIPSTLKPLIGPMQNEVGVKTKVYQDVRLYATNVQDAASVIWGEVSTCILPVLYALLGACAYVLRTFTEQTERRTFAPSYATPARFIIAAIGGGVVGLFSNFTIAEGPSLSPLALAFLIGYAADMFFTFLEGSIPNHNTVRAR
jgi:hypothetical protein